LLVIAQSGSAASRETEPMECGDVRRGSEIQRQTDAIRSHNGRFVAFATIVLRRSAADTEGDQCQAVYRMFVQERGSQTRQVKELAEVRSDIVGVTLVGFSPDGFTIAAEFWWAEGDYTAVRPVIYSLKNRTAAMRELDGNIIRQLPSCDYSQTFERITNSGDRQHISERNFAAISPRQQNHDDKITGQHGVTSRRRTASAQA
jgi:hypothetical protein